MGLDLNFYKEKKQEIGYFRKVNFLVRFFEEKGMDVDNQHPYRINKEDLEDLLDRTNKVLENNDLAEKLLPTMGGFFFGSTDYDEYYFQDVKNVNNSVKRLLEEYNNLNDDEYITFDIWY